MERKRLKKEIEKLLKDYVGIRLREKEFDPRGQRPLTFLDDMVHYNLALRVALLWLSDLDAPTALTREQMNFAAHNQYTYPNRTEREAMILSSYAGILMNSIPVEEILETYSMKPSTTHWQSSANDHSIQPFKFSLHPFAMLTAPEAAEYAWKQGIKYKTATAHQKNGPFSARRTKKDHQQLDPLTRGKQQVDKGATGAKQGISTRKPGTDSKLRNAKEAKTEQKPRIHLPHLDVGAQLKKKPLPTVPEEHGSLSSNPHL